MQMGKKCRNNLTNKQMNVIEWRDNGKNEYQFNYNVNISIYNIIVIWHRL